MPEGIEVKIAIDDLTEKESIIFSRADNVLI
jgi:hypothetical protein